MINFDPPRTADDYVHRVGRTGRAGRTGTGVTLVLPEQELDVSRLAGRLGHADAFAASGISVPGPGPARAERRLEAPQAQGAAYEQEAEPADCREEGARAGDREKRERKTAKKQARAEASASPAVEASADPTSSAMSEPGLIRRDELRNVAIVAHVDHGKTTLVDAMLWQSGSFRENQDVAERVHGLDGPRAREGDHDPRQEHGGVGSATTKINIVDTPGHADFGGEVERGLTMVDGVLLLVDASEGPLPQTRFVLRKALELKLPVVLVVNKVDRPRRAAGRGRERGLRALPRPRRGRVADRVPDRLRERARRARRASPRTSSHPTSMPLFDTLLETIPAPSYDPEHPLQALVTNLDASPYVGRLALLRIRHGTLRKGAPIAWCRADGTIETARVTELYVTEALDRVPADEAGPGEIVALAGLPEVTIGETIADPDDPRPLPVTTVDEPSLSVTIGINTSPLAGTEGTRLTASQVKERLDAELVGNVSLRVLPDVAAGRLGGAGPRRAAARDPRRADAPRGLRADGRQAGGADEGGRRQAATSRSSASRSTFPRSTSASSRSCSRCARAALQQMVNHGTGWARMEYLVPARGADRLPHRVPHRDARHRDPPPRLRGVGAVARRAAHAADRQPRRRPARAGDRVRDRSTCRSAARSSSRPATSSTRG